MKGDEDEKENEHEPLVDVVNCTNKGLARPLREG